MKKKYLLSKLYNNTNLNQSEAEDLMTLIATQQLTETEITAILMFYILNEITIDELLGFKNSLIQESIRFNINFNAIDVCGTGGDNKNTFNISTLTALVVASCGYKVVKHGNYGASSICGSSNVLNYLGYTFSNNKQQLLNQLDKTNICFLHAPLFHPSLSKIAPIRKQISTKTIFNLLGPLVNPCNVSHQLIGVHNLSVMRKFDYIFQTSKIKYSIVHSLDGYDEISLTGQYKITNRNSSYVNHPNQLNLKTNTQKSLYSGNSIKNSAKIFINVLNNKATYSQTNAVVVNSAYALQLITNQPINHCLMIAQEALLSNKTLHTFNTLIKKQNEYTN